VVNLKILPVVKQKAEPVIQTAVQKELVPQVKNKLTQKNIAGLQIKSLGRHALLLDENQCLQSQLLTS